MWLLMGDFWARVQTSTVNSDVERCYSSPGTPNSAYIEATGPDRRRPGPGAMTCNMQNATCNTQHAAVQIQNTKAKYNICTMQHATCNMQHARPAAGVSFVIDA